jgi:hypothetical protein
MQFTRYTGSVALTGRIESLTFKGNMAFEKHATGDPHAITMQETTSVCLQLNETMLHVACNCHTPKEELSDEG